MENGLYSIGKVSSIMGISVQTLRHYCDIGLVQPKHIDSETGYRYFSFEQFHYIDRARYLLKCGFKLKEIKQVLVGNDIDLLIQYLCQKKKEKLEEIKDAYDIIDTLDWYQQYFTYGKMNEASTSYYVKHMEARYLIAVACDPSYTHLQFYPLFNQIKNSEPYKHITYMRQFTAILDYDALMQKTMRRFYVGMLAMKDPGFRSANIVEIPAGEYYCFKAAILSDNWNPYLLKMFRAEEKRPKLLLTSEYEDDLQNFKECMHEVQILFEPD